MKKYSKILIGLAVSVPIAITAIVTPLVLMSNKTELNVLSDNTNNNFSSQVVLKNCQFEVVDSSKTSQNSNSQQKEVKITLAGENLNQVQKQDLIITNRSTGAQYLGSQHISSLVYDSTTTNLEALLVASNVEMGDYQVTYTSSNNPSTSVSASFYPEFASSNYRSWFNWNDQIKLQLKSNGNLLLDLNKSTVKVEQTNNNNNDVTDKFNVTVSGVYLVLTMKPNSNIALNSDAELTVTLEHNNVGQKTTQKVGIFSKTKTVVSKVETSFGGDNKVTLTIFGQALPLTNEDFKSKLTILKWDSSNPNQAGTATYVTDKFTVSSSGLTHEKLILEGTFEGATKDNCRFDVRAYV